MKNYLIHFNLLFVQYKFIFPRKWFIVILLFITSVLASAEAKDASFACGLSISQTNVDCTNGTYGSLTVTLTANETGVFILNWTTAATPIAVISYTVNTSDIDNNGIFQGDIFAITGLEAGYYSLEVITPNNSTCIAVATIIASGMPQNVCPPPIVEFTDPGLCTTTLSVSTAPHPCFDNTPGEATVVVPAGANSVPVVNVDIFGNLYACNIFINITDNEDPSIYCPSDILVTTNNGMCGNSVAWEIAADDNCGINNISSTCFYPDGSQTPCTSGGQFPIGTTWVLNTVTDNSQNMNTCIFSIVVDNATSDNLSFTGDIPDGTYYANQNIVSNGNVVSNGDVEFKAGQCIKLEQSFTVQPNTNFSAEILDCQ